MEEEGKEECLQGKLEAQQGQQGLAPDSSRAAAPLWDSGSRISAGKDAEPRPLLQGVCPVPCCLEHLSISSLAWTAAPAPAGVLPKGLCSSIALLPAPILPPAPHRQP